MVVNQIEMIGRAQHGDDAAWDSLVREHQTAVFRLAYLLLHDAADAEDIAQETFVRAWRALDRFDPARPLRPWLLRITSNLARNKYRSARRALQAFQRLLVFTPATYIEPAYDNVQGDAQLLWQALQRLGPNDQEIVYLRYFLELSEAETATTLQIAPGTVKSRLHRAMARLRHVVATEFPALHEERQV